MRFTGLSLWNGEMLVSDRKAVLPISSLFPISLSKGMILRQKKKKMKALNRNHRKLQRIRRVPEKTYSSIC